MINSYYSLFRNDRSSRIGGGVALYVSQKVFSTNVIPVNDTECELLCVDCYFKQTARAKLNCVRCIV